MRFQIRAFSHRADVRPGIPPRRRIIQPPALIRRSGFLFHIMKNQHIRLNQ